MSPWDSISRWINTVLLVIVGVLGFDTLFRLLEANEANVIVGFARTVASVLLAPFQGMFDEQEFLLTALIAVLGYALLAGVCLAVLRSVQASRRRSVVRHTVPGDADGPSAPGADHTEDLGGGPTSRQVEDADRAWPGRTGGGPNGP